MVDVHWLTTIGHATNRVAFFPDWADDSYLTGLAFALRSEGWSVDLVDRKGLAHALVSHAGEQIRSTRNYREFELNWVGSFNPRMIALVESFGAIRNKTFATFRKELTS